METTLLRCWCSMRAPIRRVLAAIALGIVVNASAEIEWAAYSTAGSVVLVALLLAATAISLRLIDRAEHLALLGGYQP